MATSDCSVKKFSMKILQPFRIKVPHAHLSGPSLTFTFTSNFRSPSLIPSSVAVPSTPLATRTPTTLPDYHHQRPPSPWLQPPATSLDTPPSGTPWPSSYPLLLQLHPSGYTSPATHIWLHLTSYTHLATPVQLHPSGYTYLATPLRQHPSGYILQVTPLLLYFFGYPSYCLSYWLSSNPPTTSSSSSYLLLLQLHRSCYTPPAAPLAIPLSTIQALFQATSPTIT